jgi:hypothetical protein
MITPMRRRQLLAGAATFLLTASLVATNHAAAYTTRLFQGCDPITWTSAPRVVLHVAELSPSFTLAQSFQLIDAMEDIHAQFNQVGATSAQVTSFELSSDPFVFKSWFNDAVPTIHVGFTSNASAALGGTFWDNPNSACQYDEAHIQFQDVGVANWNFNVPETSGEKYYESGEKDASGAKYFRISYLHELIHSFGLSHSANSLSMLNYGDRPWANRVGDDAIRPLPDDVEALRDLYPATGARTEVAVLNSWFDDTTLSSGAYPAAQQTFLCQPSLGDTWDASIFADQCGTSGGQPGSNLVCSGDTLRTRFALANYSTDDVDVEAHLWFSVDDQWDALDYESATTRQFTVNANVSSQQGRVWTVPSLPQGSVKTAWVDYYVIARVTATTPAGLVVNDWIPLRGTVRTGQALCRRWP